MIQYCIYMIRNIRSLSHKSKYKYSISKYNFVLSLTRFLALVNIFNSRIVFISDFGSNSNLGISLLLPQLDRRCWVITVTIFLKLDTNQQP